MQAIDFEERGKAVVLANAAIAGRSYGVRLSELVDKLEVIGLVSNGAIAKGADNCAVAQIEDARHLVGIFSQQTDAMLTDRSLDPGLPYLWHQQVEGGVHPAEPKDGPLIQRSLRIAYALNVSQIVVVEIRLGALWRTKMDKHRAYALLLDLLPDFRNIVQRLAAKGAAEMA